MPYASWLNIPRKTRPEKSSTLLTDLSGATAVSPEEECQRQKIHLPVALRQGPRAGAPPSGPRLAHQSMTLLIPPRYPIRNPPAQNTIPGLGSFRRA